MIVTPRGVRHRRRTTGWPTIVGPPRTAGPRATCSAPRSASRPRSPLAAQRVATPRSSP